MGAVDSSQNDPETAEAYRPRRSSLRRFLVVSGIVGALTLVAGFWMLRYIAGSFTTPYTGRVAQEFSKEAWLAGAKDWEGSRYLMLGNLTGRHQLVGMTRSEVLDLLGPMQPPGYPEFGDCYYLGPEDHPMAVDNAWLVLEFDRDRVTKWRVATD